MKEINKLVEYLNEVYKRGDVCVFYNLSGHVDWFDIRIARSKEEYSKVLYEIDCMKPENVNADEIIKEIKAVLKNLKAEKRKATTVERELERAELKRLKKKYE